MLDGLTIDTTAFASSYASLQEGPRLYKEEMREALAAAKNCISIGDTSSYADMVAVPRDYPDVVIKICSGGDAFINYARLCVDRTLNGKHHLKIYSEAEIAPGVWLFVMERLEGRLGHDLWSMTVSIATGADTDEPLPEYADVCKGLTRDIAAISTAFADNEYSYYSDLHMGNVMLRKDGTIVLLDPVC